MSGDHESDRLRRAREDGELWRRWGPYLSERQWGTVREDYSAGGDAWNYFPHDHARSRAYRWGEEGLAGLSDDRQRLCIALALWNGAALVPQVPVQVPATTLPLRRAGAQQPGAPAR